MKIHENIRHGTSNFIPSLAFWNLIYGKKSHFPERAQGIWITL